MKLMLAVFLNLLFLWSTLVRAKCPAAYKILPCKCEENNDGLILKAVITCERLEDEENLASAMFPARDEKIFMVQIKNSSFMFFPEGLFMGNQVEVLKIQDSSIFSVGESNPAFSGLENTLEELQVSRCAFVNNWKWTELDKMKWLRSLEISGSELLELPNLNISHLPIENLNFKNNFIKEIPYKGFHNFYYLKRLALDNNDIVELMRSMLPTPAKYLEAIGLSFNNLKRLPINIFDKMPALKYLYLGGNPLHTLKEEVFKPVWNQLKMALFNNCPLVCDCYIRWIPKSKHAKEMLVGGTCDSPMQLKDKRLTQLLPRHFPSC